MKLVPEERELYVKKGVKHAPGNRNMEFKCKNIMIRMWEVWKQLRLAPLMVINHYLSCAEEDMWHVYNLIREGDRVTATTFRKINKDSGVGADSERVKIKLTVEVEGVDFDAEGNNSGKV